RESVISNILRGLDAEKAAQFLMSYDKARYGKDPKTGKYRRSAPLALNGPSDDDSEWKLNQAELLRTLALYGAPPKLGGIANKLEGADSLEELKSAGNLAFDNKWLTVDKIDPTTGKPAATNIPEKTLNWLTSGAARNAGIDDDFFGEKLG